MKEIENVEIPTAVLYYSESLNPAPDQISRTFSPEEREAAQNQVKIEIQEMIEAEDACYERYLNQNTKPDGFERKMWMEHLEEREEGQL
jgi:hypothetical protein